MRKLLKLTEALLFAAGRPIEKTELAQAAGCSTQEIDKVLVVLAAELDGRGVALATYGDSMELVTSPDLAKEIDSFLESETARPLSQPALETLAIILHKQPVTKMEIEEVRGVGSDQIVSNLINLGLVVEAGARNEPGRPMTYRPSPLALKQIGVTDIEQLTEMERGESEN